MSLIFMNLLIKRIQNIMDRYIYNINYYSDKIRIMPSLIDPDKIYPKRMGIHRGALVIEYYNLERDCFKKHLIPIDNTETAQKNVENILKNQKHAIFLRKVAPEHLKRILINQLGGAQTNLLPSDINQRSHSSSEQRTSNNTSSKNQSHSLENTSKLNSVVQQSMKSIDQSFKNKQNNANANIEDSYGYSMNFQEDLSISIARKIIEPQTKPKDKKMQDNYDDDFEQFQPEEIQQTQAQINRKKQQQKQKEKQKQKKKRKKSQSVKAQQLLEEFDFLDQQPKKKKKKKKKDKSKDKKNKQSKQSSNNNSVVSKEDVPVQEQFDFI